MPYKTIWVEPEVFLEHNGVTVYHTYKDDDIEEGARCYWFTLQELGGEYEGAFDVRDLDTDKLLANHPTHNSGPGGDARRAVLRNAIDKGLLACQR